MTSDFVVIKIGTSSIIKGKIVNGGPIKEIGREITKLKNERNLQAVLVVSGAIGLGMNILGYTVKPRTRIGLQRCAGVGQIELAKAYAAGLAECGLVASQYLLTHHNFSSEEESANITRNIYDDAEEGIIPVVNYNDKVDWEEVTRDNDRLAANIALLSRASALVILTSNVDGFLAAGKVVPEIKVDRIPEYEKLCFGADRCGTGGFATKLEAAKMVAPFGIKCIIGNVKYSISDLLDGAVERTVAVR